MTRHACPTCYRPVRVKDHAKEGRCQRCRPKGKQTPPRPREREPWEEREEEGYREQRLSSRTRTREAARVTPRGA